MLISGLQKLTLLDYPGTVACTVFTGGCNFRCPFCHNAALVRPEELSRENEEEQVLSFLKKRVGVLDGVAITGGEPLLHADMPAFLEKIRNPYEFRVGSVTVRTSFGSGVTMDECFANYLAAI